ncbi:hypothetical protein CAP35_01445 [Chitinophagaceae bacterium IBVUCB1]|nr:hypothetical protein CAP35_01445 [Chitinophagaceae bacterium IBVUCB1]
MASLQKLFMPDGQKFYRLFDEVADNLVVMGKLYYETICAGDGIMLQNISKLDELEKAIDVSTRKLFHELGRNFITPFDREDIHALASGLDDIADLTYGTIRQMNNYGLTNPGNTTQYVAGEYKRLIALLTDSIKSLNNKRNLAKLASPCREMRKIINLCDNRIDAAITGLFPTNTNVVDIIKWMEHYDILQVLLEKCENVVDTIEAIVIKYS